MLFLAKTNIHKYPIATIVFLLPLKAYKIGNGNPIPQKQKSNKTDFYRIYILVAVEYY